MPPRVPVRRQIIDDIRARISSGEWPPGTKLPSIAELCVSYECSDTPVKQALTVLQELGLIDGHQGRGNYVAGGSPA